ncbi:MAG: type II toxin-antitoxin system RelE/ParE family toxin [Dehalococcoidia bacterium]|nr:type II toxin-antitoxin system RelE/ParE family toxin [Dehalococcoidia bacterium]
MRLQLEYPGKKFDIYYIVLNNGSCPANDFLENVKQNRQDSHKSLIALLKRHADDGPIFNIKKSRPIEGYQKLLEFKSRQGDRLIYFYLPDKKTVLIDGFHKGAVAETEYRKADTIKNNYLREAENG